LTIRFSCLSRLAWSFFPSPTFFRPLLGLSGAAMAALTGLAALPAVTLFLD
jgi:hypothetical protein